MRVLPALLVGRPGDYGHELGLAQVGAVLLAAGELVAAVVTLGLDRHRQQVAARLALGGGEGSDDRSAQALFLEGRRLRRRKATDYYAVEEQRQHQVARVGGATVGEGFGDGRGNRGELFARLRIEKLARQPGREEGVLQVRVELAAFVGAIGGRNDLLIRELFGRPH